MDAKTASEQRNEPSRRDWVEEAYAAFVKDAEGIDPTNPVKAVEAYFKKNATDELKARCRAEGKDARGCWTFVEAVARKALGGRNGHIDPGVVFAIAMHWFEDVPADWNKPAKAAGGDTVKARKTEGARKNAARRPAETPSEIRKEKERMAKAKAKAKTGKKKPGVRQGFFFEMLETPESPEGKGEAANVDERGGESC